MYINVYKPVHPSFCSLEATVLRRVPRVSIPVSKVDAYLHVCLSRLMQDIRYIVYSLCVFLFFKHRFHSVQFLRFGEKRTIEYIYRHRNGMLDKNAQIRKVTHTRYSLNDKELADRHFTKLSIVPRLKGICLRFMFYELFARNY